MPLHMSSRLNRTNVELKHRQPQPELAQATGLNRTNVELKPGFDLQAVSRALSLNRTNVELKHLQNHLQAFGDDGLNRTNVELKLQKVPIACLLTFRCLTACQLPDHHCCHRRHQ